MIAQSQRGNVDMITPVILFRGAEGRGEYQKKDKLIHEKICAAQIGTEFLRK